MNDISIELLRDIRTEWPGDEPFIPTKALLEKLHVLDERPWGEWRRGQPMSERAFALRLKLFGIYSRSNGHVRGYDRDSFSDGDYNYYLTNYGPFSMLLLCGKATTHRGKHTERA